MVLRVVLFCVIVIAATCLARAVYEPRILKVSRVSMGKGDKKIKILFFSDIHAKYFFVPVKKIISLIVSSDADIVLFGGDMTSKSGKGEIDKAKDIFEKLSNACKNSQIPFYAVVGNHDIYGLDREISGNKGPVFLYNESVAVKSHDGSNWLLCGLEDIRSGFPDYAKAVEDKDGNDMPEIILAHNPDTLLALPFPGILESEERSLAQNMYEKHFNRYSKNTSSINSNTMHNKFFLSGHFHGGQIWLPFGLEYKILRKEIMADMGYRKGLFEFRGLKGYITRGMGCTIFPFRFFSYPEIVILELRSG